MIHLAGIQDRPMIGTSGGITICAQNMGIVAGTRLRAETCRTVCRFGKHSSWKVPKETRSYLGIVWVRFKRKERELRNVEYETNQHQATIMFSALDIQVVPPGIRRT